MIAHRAGDRRTGMVALGIALAVAAVGLGIALPHRGFWQSLTVATVKFAALGALWGAAWLVFRSDPGRPLDRRWVLVALAFEALCDVSIEFNVVVGGAASALGMIFYSLAFLSFPRGRHGKVAPVVSWALVFTTVFVLVAWGARTFAGEGFGGPDLAYSLYMAVLSTTVAFSLGRDVPWAGRLAILLFYASDYFVYFGAIWGRQPVLALANGLTYYSAQVLFAGSWGGRKPGRD